MWTARGKSDQEEFSKKPLLASNLLKTVAPCGTCELCQSIVDFGQGMSLSQDTLAQAPKINAYSHRTTLLRHDNHARTPL